MPKARTFTLDLPLGDEAVPQPDEVLVTALNLYRVTAVRPVESRIWPNRWKVTTEPLGPHHGRIPEGGRMTTTYARGEGPEDVFGPVDDPPPDP